MTNCAKSLDKSELSGYNESKKRFQLSVSEIEKIEQYLSKGERVEIVPQKHEYFLNVIRRKRI